MVIATIARSTLSRSTWAGKNSGSSTEPMNRMVTSGVPRKNSIHRMLTIRTAGICERRPSAIAIPIGSAATIPMIASTRVSISPPQSEVRATFSPSHSPCSSANASSGKPIRAARPAFQRRAGDSSPGAART